MADGSSPRVRGTRSLEWTRGCGRRFIPARAGNSYRVPYGHHVRTVHPRACGELSDAMSLYARFTGSSPRVRGTRCSSLPAWEGKRFIPARAGKTPGRPCYDSDGFRFIPARAGNS